MLIQFSVKNFRSFREKATLNLSASNYDKETREEENVVRDEGYNLRILKSAVLYGANASGKSKFFESMVFMKEFVLSSSKNSQKGDKISVTPFRLNPESENEPSEFEVLFTHNNVMFRYGFEVTKDEVISEWLYTKPNTKEVELFYRDLQNFEIHSRNFKKGSIAVKEQLIRENALLLPLAGQLNDSIANEVIQWFRNLKIISGLSEDGYHGYTVSRANTPEHKSKILELVKAADLGIQNIELQLLDIEKLPKDMPKEIREKILKETKEENAQYISDLLISHKKFDNDKTPVENANFSFEEDESSGTKKFFALTGPILDVLENGYTLVVDELDSKLHPNLVCKIVSLFNSKKSNPNNSQLIFNTHDTNLLDSGLFRRDQIWFSEKDRFGESILYSLGDFKSDEVRKNEPFENNYIRGKYGAIPFLEHFENLNYNKSAFKHENEK